MDRPRPSPNPLVVHAIIPLALLATALSGQAVADARDGGRGGDLDETLLALPSLGNTPEGDRPLLREVPDDHVHAFAPSGGSGGADGAVAPGAGPHASVDGAPGATADAAAAERAPAEDAWGRVRRSRRLAVPDNEAVRAERRTLREEALWIGKILRRADPYVGHVVAALDARYLPLELALLPAIESGFRPQARSPDQAVGLWQLMPRTAREIGVRRGDWYDGRTDVVASTAAALDYLSYLNSVFHGDWELTLAAYNAGPGRVRAAIRRNRAAERPTDFWSLPLPSETRRYVPKLLALVGLLRDEAGDALDVPRLPSEPTFVKVDVGRRISLDRAAELGASPEPVLRRLNGGLIHGVTPPAGPHELYVPRARHAAFVARLARAPSGPLYSLPSTHVVVAGDTLSSLALAYGVSEQRLLTLNGLDDARIRVGQRLAVLDARHANGASVEHVVASGETLSEIARRYAVGVEAISRRDGSALDGDVIHPGQSLRVQLLAPSAG